MYILFTAVELTIFHFVSGTYMSANHPAERNRSN